MDFFSVVLGLLVGFCFGAVVCRSSADHYWRSHAERRGRVCSGEQFYYVLTEGDYVEMETKANSWDQRERRRRSSRSVGQ